MSGTQAFAVDQTVTLAATGQSARVTYAGPDGGVQIQFTCHRRVHDVNGVCAGDYINFTQTDARSAIR